MSETNGDYEARNEENSVEGFGQWCSKLGNGCSPALLAQVHTTGVSARETEISPVQSRRRSLGFFKIRKNGAPVVKRGCSDICAGMDVPDR